MDDHAEMRRPATVGMTVAIVAAYVAHNHVRADDLPALIATTHAALASLTGPAALDESQVERPTPAQIRRSITHDALISFVDGKPYRTLKRHLGTQGLTVEDYRARYGLPDDYPSVAPGYSQARSTLARSFGLGRKVVAPAPEPQPAASTPRPRGRRKAVEPAT